MAIPVGRQSRNRGRNYEYRVRDTLRKLEYESERVVLSGGCEAVNKITQSEHDVIGEKDGLRIDIECKKTAGKKHITIKKEALEKITFVNKKTNRIGFMSFSYGGDTTDYAVLPMADLLLMLEKLFGDQK